LNNLQLISGGRNSIEHLLLTSSSAILSGCGPGLDAIKYQHSSKPSTLVASVKTHPTIAMDRQTFIDHFKLLLVHLHDWTSQNCFNELSDNYKFIIEPSERTVSDHLTEKENGYLKVWNKLQGRQISFHQVVDLFYQDDKTPKWVDSSIYFSTPNLTVVHLFFSREFREENEVYYLDRGTGPFKAVVGMPPDNRKIMKGDKFDVNWKKYWDDEKNKSRFITKLKRIFKTA
jgi:hypothetical protein